METRYDYFLIWGHGLQHKESILEMIRAEKSFEIKKIIEHEPKDIKKFVKEIYSHDYAPLEHLKGKTNYLLSTPPKVIFIFIKNNNIDSEYFGEGEYRHIESKTIKKLKEKIRNTYNDKNGERRSENHVIHASDNEEQTDYILKYLGYTEGVDIFEPYQNIISFSNLNHNGLFTIKNISVENIYSTILTSDKKNPKIITELVNSPHFKYLKGDKKTYINYTEKFKGVYLQDGHGADKFEDLIKSFNYLDNNHPTNYIMLKKLEQEKYLILDGLHRTAILKNKGYTHILSAIIE